MSPEIIPPPEVVYTGKHLEAAFAFRANHHKQRILQAFGVSEALPPLSGNPGVVVLESERRFKKSYDLLNRERPLELPVFDGELSRDYVISLADNLVWRGIEDSITVAHLDEINRVLMQASTNERLAGSQQIADLKSRRKVLKKVAIQDNHFYRDFFNSEQAAELGLDSPATMNKFLKRVSLTGNNSESVVRVARGVSLEIAAGRYLTGLVESDNQETTVSFGSSDQDREGGDIVIVRGTKILYVDLKSMRPQEISSSEVEEGFRLSADREKGIYKAIVWPETEDPVADDSFRLSDPSLKNTLQKVMSVTS
jgi:hypothetical protein